MEKIEIDDEMFYCASLDVLLNAILEDNTEEQKKTGVDTDDDFVKVEKYQRPTEEER